MSKKQTSVESSSFVSAFIAVKQCCEYICGLWYRLQMMGICLWGINIHKWGQPVSISTHLDPRLLFKEEEPLWGKLQAEMNGTPDMSTLMKMSPISCWQSYYYQAISIRVLWGKFSIIYLACGQATPWDVTRQSEPLKWISTCFFWFLRFLRWGGNHVGLGEPSILIQRRSKLSICEGCTSVFGTTKIVANYATLTVQYEMYYMYTSIVSVIVLWLMYMYCISTKVHVHVHVQ